MAITKKRLRHVAKKPLHVWIPENLYTMYQLLCIKEGLSLTDGIVSYLEYLDKTHAKQRRLLNAKSYSVFKPIDPHTYDAVSGTRTKPDE